MFSQLREAIAADHIAIEKTDYAVAMADGSIDREDYLFGLAQLYYIHEALEAAVTASAELKPFFTEKMVRTTAIERDLAHFEKRIEDVPVIPETAAIVADIVRLAQHSPMALLAHIYVLEGSRMGSLVLIKPIAQALGVQPMEKQGMDYHVEGARETPVRLKGWKETVSKVEWEGSLFDDILTAARQFMGDLCELYAALPASGYSRKSVA